MTNLELQTLYSERRFIAQLTFFVTIHRTLSRIPSLTATDRPFLEAQTGGFAGIVCFSFKLASRVVLSGQARYLSFQQQFGELQPHEQLREDSGVGKDNRRKRETSMEGANSTALVIRGTKVWLLMKGCPETAGSLHLQGSGAGRMNLAMSRSRSTGRVESHTICTSQINCEPKMFSRNFPERGLWAAAVDVRSSATRVVGLHRVQGHRGCRAELGRMRGDR